MCFLLLTILVSLNVFGSELDLHKSLLGVWRSEYRNAEGNIIMVGHSVYRDDGKFFGSCIYMYPNQKDVPLTYSGEWTIDGEYLVSKGLTSSDPSLLPVNLTVKVKILNIGKKAYTFEGPRGGVYTDYRIEKYEPVAHP